MRFSPLRHQKSSLTAREDRAENGIPASQALRDQERVQRGLAGAGFRAFLDGELVSQLGATSGVERVARCPGRGHSSWRPPGAGRNTRLAR